MFILNDLVFGKLENRCFKQQTRNNKQKIEIKKVQLEIKQVLPHAMMPLIDIWAVLYYYYYWQTFLLINSRHWDVMRLGL